MTDDWGDLAGAGFEKFRLSHKDRALVFIENERDFEAQLYAIAGALRRNKEAEAKVLESINAMDEQIAAYAGNDDQYAMHMDNHRVDLLHGSVFSDAAHSMAAVGMLAPFVESLFAAVFEAIRKEQAGEDQHARQKVFEDAYWNPQIVFRKGEFGNDLVSGIGELAEDVGLKPFLPDGYHKTLTALFAYRNNMFHNGFEWPLETRNKFLNRMKNKHWPCHWFKRSSTGDEPWIFYMSDVFIAHCLKMIDQVLEGVGRYLEQRRTGPI